VSVLSRFFRLPYRCVANGEDQHCRTRVASKGERCANCWQRLANSKNVQDRIRAASAPSLPEKVFVILAVDPEVLVRTELAKRDDLPTWVCYYQGRGLAADREPAVRRQLAGNRKASPEADWLLVHDEDPSVATTIVMKTTDMRLLQEATRHPNPYVRATVAASPLVTEDLEMTLAYRDDRIVLVALAEKPSTCDIVLTWLSQHPDYEISSPASGQLYLRRTGQAGVHRSVALPAA
jgi:hypothetical protein